MNLSILELMYLVGFHSYTKFLVKTLVRLFKKWIIGLCKQFNDIIQIIPFM